MARNHKRRIAEFLAAGGWSTIGDSEWEALRREFPEVPERALRNALQETDLAVDQPWLGVISKSLEELAESLVALAAVYAEKPALARLTRELVIQAKDRAKFASRNPKVDAGKREVKSEMVEWMLVWLGDPAMFEVWVRIRESTRSRSAQA